MNLENDQQALARVTAASPALTEPPISTGEPLACACQPAWYRTITPLQWRTLFAALLGWMLDAMDFVLYLMALTTLKDQFQYGADTAGLLATVALVVSACGGVLFGLVADRFGRTRALMATIVLFSLGSLGTATAQDLWQLILWRAVVGLGVGGEWSSGAVLVSETWPPQHRDKAISIMQSGWALGYILAAVAAAIVLPTLGWRWLFALGALPALLVLWVRRAVPEPELWLAQRTAPARTGSPLAALFGSQLLGRTILATLLMGSVLFAYWGVFSWLPAFLASPIDKGGAGMSVVDSLGWIVTLQLGAFAGYLSFGFIADRVGRRWAFGGFLIASAVLVPLYGRLTENPMALMILGPFLGFFGHGYLSLFGALFAELYPTDVRATGQGFCYSSARLISAMAPFTVGALAQNHGIGPALGLTSAFFLLGAILILFLPNTRGARLEEVRPGTPPSPAGDASQ
jgi:MFS family permease